MIDVMTRLIRRLAKMWAWLRSPPERANARGVTILMWVLIFGTYVTGLVADNGREEQARHTAVCTVSVALNDLYDYAQERRLQADPHADISDITEARARLSRVIPDENC